jgi:hypothetical protein
MIDSGRVQRDTSWHILRRDGREMNKKENQLACDCRCESYEW